MADEEIVHTINEQLPQWKIACDNKDAEMVIIQQQAFKRSVDDSYLLVVAIRYAGLVGKSVIIAPYEMPDAGAATSLHDPMQVCIPFVGRDLRP